MDNKMDLLNVLKSYYNLSEKYYNLKESTDREIIGLKEALEECENELQEEVDKSVLEV